MKPANRPFLTRYIVSAGGITPTIAALAFGAIPPAALAQLTPDDTLGSEPSIVTEGAIVGGEVTDLIEGGAPRGGNLFHSFLEFNITDGQRVFFANPLGIENILSRVTGGDPSNILGTLGVDGPANLFFMNPNGIAFGPDAMLNIPGSFHATTAEVIPLGDVGIFSATAPEQSTLLTVDPSVVFTNYLTADSGDITSQGQLAAAGDVTLAANALELTGGVAAGGDLTLLGLDTVQIRDAVDAPFIGFAGGDLLVQGNEQVDIVALSHPDSGLYSYGDMVLRSANPVGGDAHYWSAGDFRIESLNHALGSLESPVDPVIRSAGDVAFDNYFGASLHIISGGSITVPGVILITGTDNANPLSQTFDLSDGTSISIDGGMQPTLDLRSGVENTQIGTPFGLDGNNGSFVSFGFVFGLPDISNNATSADIQIGGISIAVADGLVFMSSNYEPNLDLPDGEIAVNLIRTNDAFSGFVGNSGQIVIDSRNNINLTGTIIDTTSSTGNAGDIRLIAENDISLLGAEILTQTFGAGDSGKISIEAGSFEMANGSQIITTTRGQGSSGDIEIRTEDLVSIQDNSLILLGTFSSGSGSNFLAQTNGRFQLSDVSEGAIGGIINTVATDPTSDDTSTTGIIDITAENLLIANGALLSSLIFGKGTSEGISISVGESAVISAQSGSPQTGVFSTIEENASGAAGDITIHSGSVISLDNAEINTQVSGQGIGGDISLTSGGRVLLGDAAEVNSEVGGQGVGGDILIYAHDDIDMIGSNISSGLGFGLFTDASGEGGDITIITSGSINSLDSLISSINAGNGSSGNIFIQADQDISLLSSGSGFGQGSSISSSTAFNSIGDGGNIEIQANSLNITDVSRINSSTVTTGNAGNISIDVEDTFRITDSGFLLGVISSSVTTFLSPDELGNAGDIDISAGELLLTNGGIQSFTTSTGNSGDIYIDADRVVLDTTEVRSPSLIDSSTSFETGNGGDIVLEVDDLELFNGSRITASTGGSGTAGSIFVEASGSVRVSGFRELQPFSFGNGFDNSLIRIPSRLSTDSSADGFGGDIEIFSDSLILENEGTITSEALGEGNAGKIIVRAADIVSITDAEIATSTGEGSVAQGGTIEIRAPFLNLSNRARITAQSEGEGQAGSITLDVSERLEMLDSEVTTEAQRSSGGSIRINTSDDFSSGIVLLRGDSDIKTSSLRNGGDITIRGGAVVALDDSDILTTSDDGLGGNITLINFFSENDPFDGSPPFDGNNRVDINAEGRIASGTVSLTDISFIQNSLSDFDENIVDTAALTAGSCIARSDDAEGSFVVTGGEGLPQRPGGDNIAVYPTGTVQTVPESTPAATLQEPQSVYRLADGRLVLSHECE